MGLRAETPKWNIHPGEILREEFLKPMKLTPYALAKVIRVPAPRVNEIVLERRGITADTVRLSRFFGNTPEFWMNAQSFYEVQLAKKRLSRELNRIEPARAS
jgi:addiction module HigA family antidote